MMLHSCALLGIETVTENAVPSAVVLIGKFINHQNPHFTIPPPPWVENVQRPMMPSCERHRAV